MPTTVNADAYFTNTGNVTFGLAGNTVSASSPAGGASPTFSLLSPFGMRYAINGQTNEKTLSVWPMNAMAGGGQGIAGLFPGIMTVSTMMMLMAKFNVNITNSSGSLMFSVGIYTLNGSTLSIHNSVSTQVTWDAVSNNTTGYAGSRWLTIHSSQWSAQPVFSRGNYWFGLLANSSNATQSIQFLLVNQDANSITGTLGLSQSNGTMANQAPWRGIYISSTTALPVSIGTNQLSWGQKAAPCVIFNNIFSAF